MLTVLSNPDALYGLHGVAVSHFAKAQFSRIQKQQDKHPGAFPGNCRLPHRPTVGRRVIGSRRACDAGSLSTCHWHFLQVSIGPGVLQCLGTSSGSERPTLSSFLKQEALELFLHH